jgi:pimeloyl-ACP methyl ester carboxylesterase
MRPCKDAIMPEHTPVVLVPGLNCSARLYGYQIPHLWRFGPVLIANHARGDTMTAIASNVLAEAPPRFALVGFSFGGYIVFEMLRQARERITKLALLNTSARPDTPQQAERRRERIAIVESGRFDESLDLQYPLVVHRSRIDDPELRRLYQKMATEYGAEVCVRHLKASISRPDSRPDLATIDCPAVVVVGDSDQLTPPQLAEEMVAGIKGARLVVLPKSGHLSPLERPKHVNETLIEWMTS